jgi:ATP-dependent Clp protease ATP-binding subunit ClpA
MDAARSVFRPEFMNRIDEYIVFKPLEREQINSIVKLQVTFFTLGDLSKHLQISMLKQTG